MKNKIITVFLLISLMLPQLYAQVFVSDVSKKVQQPHHSFLLGKVPVQSEWEVHL